MADFRTANTIVNGYFYSFTYNPPTLQKGYDKEPFVFVVGPSLKSLNNFVAINLHHLPEKQRIYFIRSFQRDYGFMDTPRKVISLEECSVLLSGITIAQREYNRKYITNCVRVESSKVPLYLVGDGHISQQKPDETELKWLEERGLYHSKEHS